ncbi:hypothetical protein [Erwinia oleae]|uniref:hypothetical protein n=1 Tax=Erwinia oleae TaxID=796334 RepID=UPI001269DE72|nr:hypothetical protein [Erwinia oleae]
MQYRHRNLPSPKDGMMVENASQLHLKILTKKSVKPVFFQRNAVIYPEMRVGSQADFYPTCIRFQAGQARASTGLPENCELSRIYLCFLASLF